MLEESNINTSRKWESKLGGDSLGDQGYDISIFNDINSIIENKLNKNTVFQFLKKKYIKFYTTVSGIEGFTFRRFMVYVEYLC